MRVTGSILVNTFLRNLNSNMDKISKSQEQLSSGRRINRPSDDPVGLVDALRLRTGLDELAKFKGNCEDGSSWLETTDSALNDSVNTLHRIKELTIQAASDHLTSDDRDAIVKEVGQLKQHLIQVGNTKYGDRFVFSGTETRTASFDNSGNYQGDTGVIDYEIAAGVKLSVNVDGSKAFGNLFQVMDNLISDISAGNVSDISNIRLGELDTELQNQLEVRAEVGSRLNRLEFSINRMEEMDVNMTGLLSKAEDVDITKLITQMKMQESVYNASLATGAKIIQPSLIDFLR